MKLKNAAVLGHHKIKGLAKITLSLLFLGKHWGNILPYFQQFKG